MYCLCSLLVLPSGELQPRDRAESRATVRRAQGRNVFVSTIVLYWTGFVYHFFLASEISMLGTSMPLLMNFAKAHGLNPLQLGMIWSFAASGKIFVYQSGVMIVGYSYGYFEAKDLLRIGFCLTVIESIILVLLVPFYWPLIGIR
ncbi:MAG: hypothetical protein DMG14_19700 [Acidobacteria bacterium]|nr:MAG: hypothetical protein DMG14_19700 [Acidobacteriota bacterium]